MNIPDNIGWLEDLAVHSLERGHADQASRLWAISKWIAEANTLMTQQQTLNTQLNEMVVTQREAIAQVCRDNDYLQNRLARFGA